MSRSSNSALVIDWNLHTEIRARSVGVVAEGVALGALWREDQELVVGNLETELLGDVLVVGRGLVAGTAGAVEAGACVDARGGDVAVVLAGEGIAGSAGWREGCGVDEGNRGEEDGGDDGNGLHCGGRGGRIVWSGRMVWYWYVLLL